MGKKLKRVFRDRRLTPEEIAADKQIRDQVGAEFPPRRSLSEAHSSSLSELLRRSIRESGKPIEEIAGASGCRPC